MESFADYLSNIKYFIYGGINTLPLSLAATLLIIGLFTSHYAMLFFLFGMMILAPSFAWIINTFLAKALNKESIIKSVCTLQQPFLTSKSPPPIKEPLLLSPWLSMTLFFFSYIITNAYMLLQAPPSNDGKPPPKSPATEDIMGKVEARTSRLWVALGSIIVIMCGVLYFRYKTNCEIFFKGENESMGMPIARVLIYTAIGGIGYGWCKLMSRIGENRLSDIFGIANRMITSAAFGPSGPTVCLPVP
jgi:hypothetical protein